MSSSPPDPPSRKAELLPRIYSELRRLAAAYLRREPEGHTLQPTALVHEAWMRLEPVAEIAEVGRARFLAMASRSMRRILIDHARTKGRLRRGGSTTRIPLADAPADAQQDVDVLDLDEKIRELAEIDARKAKVVELRFFAGLSVKEVAEALGVHYRTIEVDWFAARAWLRKALD